ncbi:MAG: Coenzyme F420 hydrogenase/dehydrogenase, beta subunit C-terminal domain [Sulfurimonas sp.]|nr:Coenzyme F420 hydrogenase/dehydrogenase, beta subunit C-terminal domain [Sulfurimonas sp.]
MIDKDLKIYDCVCTGCSACTEACAFPDDNGINPVQLIKNENGLAVPRINSNTCTECMMCYKACPTEDKIFNNDITYDKYEQKIGESYFGYSLDEEHRFEAATAGVATEIAAYLLETKKIDGVVSSYQNDNNEIITKIFTDIGEIKKTRGSIYRQVSLLNGLVEKIEKGNYKKLLLIGLPCHIAGLKTLHKTNKYLKKNVEFITIALFCKQTKTEEFSDFERAILKAKANQKIDYRGKGWPGVTRIEGGDSLPFNNIKIGLSWSTFAFTPEYCFACSDPLGVEADISIGDAWLPKYTNQDKIGSSLFVANSEVAKQIITEIKTDKILFIENESKENIINSQSKIHIKYKTSNIEYRSNIFGNIGNSGKAEFRYKLLTKITYFNKKFIELLYLSKLMIYIPDFFLKVYRKALVTVWKLL